MCELVWFQIRGESRPRDKVVLPVSPGSTVRGYSRWAQHPRHTAPGLEQLLGWVLLALFPFPGEQTATGALLVSDVLGNECFWW